MFAICFSFETNVKKIYTSDLLTGAIIHIIPLQDKLHVVIGYLKVIAAL